MRSAQFRSIVEPILNQAFDGVYTQRKDEYKAIVEAHGGTIRAERNPDGGLSVRVELPCGAGP